MKILFTTMAVTLFCFAVFAEDTKDGYAVGKIPDLLRENANIVIRNQSQTIKILSLNEVRVTESYAITILNEEGRKHADLVERYDKLRSITDIKGRLYDGDGNLVVKLKKNGIKEVGGVGFSFVDDDRYKTFSFNYSVYPYTVEYEIERVIHHTFLLPEWDPVPDYYCSVEHASVEVSFPSSLHIRYKQFHLPHDPIVVTENGVTKISTSISGVEALKEPVYMAVDEEHETPELLLAADDFELEDHHGSMKTWSDFGKFVYELNDHRDELPQDKKNFVHSITDTCKTPIQKINLLYDYLQRNTRYVSIQLGIGGWQTMDAGRVATTGYGDCKALSNYMKALLKEAGIASHTALVYAGAGNTKPMSPDFPIHNFNHVILFVPLYNDTVWIECTSNTLPAGYLSAFTNSRNVLGVVPGGGWVLKTPDNDEETNVLTRKAVVILSEGESNCTVTEQRRGIWWENEQQWQDQPTEKVKTYMERKYIIPTYKVVGYQFSNLRTRNPSMIESVEIAAPGLMKRSGKRAFVSQNIFGMPGKIPVVDDARDEPFEIKEGYTINDTVIIKLPSGFMAGQTPASTAGTYPFGSYSFSVTKVNDSTIMSCKYILQKKGVFAPNAYLDYVQFCKKLSASTVDLNVIATDK